jgi:GT2 family glycosyltransferase
MLVTLPKLKESKTSDTIYVLASGPSVLGVSDKEWKHIQKHDSIGFNHWYVHSFEPTYYDLSYLADDQFESKEISMYYRASHKFKNTKYILNKAISESNLEYFNDRTYHQVYINHFDLFYKDLEAIEKSKDNEIGKLASYWSKDFFNHFPNYFGELLPNSNYIYKARGQLFATVQLCVLLGYTDIRLVGVDLLSPHKFQDQISSAPISSTSPISKKGTIEKQKKHLEDALDPAGVHVTAQPTKDKDYLGIHELLRIFKEKCLNRVGVTLSVCNPDSLLTTVNIEHKKIISKLTIPKLTFCIPSKSNLRYLKTCIPSIRRNAYRKDHDIIIFVDSDEDGTVDWLEQNKQEYNFSYYVNPDLGNSLYGIGRAYDFCIEKSTTDIFMIFHADMMLGIDADLKAIAYLKEKTVVCSTRVEPPIHPNRGEKILLDFGMWPEEFKQDDFDNYVRQNKDNLKTTEGIFAPWMMYKKDFTNLGGHDPILKSCREDSDVFNRMYLAGYRFIQPWSSLVYHLTGRGAGSFSGDKKRHEKWQQEMSNSTREFIRKWGSNVLHTDLMKPIVPPKYNLGLRLYSTTPEALYHLEPWFDKIWIDTPFLLGYVQNEQKNTNFDLSSRVLIKEDKFNTDIVVHLDAKNFNNENFNYIQQLPQILKQQGQVGTFELGEMRLEVRSLKEYESSLIVR